MSLTAPSKIFQISTTLLTSHEEISPLNNVASMYGQSMGNVLNEQLHGCYDKIDQLRLSELVLT
jgi:hypothetical protein